MNNDRFEDNQNENILPEDTDIPEENIKEAGEPGKTPFDTTAESESFSGKQEPEAQETEELFVQQNPETNDIPEQTEQEPSVFADSQNRFVNPFTPKAEIPETANEPAEIVYDTSEKGEYGCSFVNQPERKKGGNGIKICALIIAALFTLTFMVYAGFSIGDRFGLFGSSGSPEEVFQMDMPEKTDKGITEIVTSNPGDKNALSVNQIAEKCRPSSVGILVETETYYFGRAYKSSGVGSGFILSEDGYIATNSHVVSGATKITVVLDDGTDYDATLVGADTITDLAVVKIEATGLPVMERGNSDELVVGDLAVAIGTPASIELAGTVTDGIISAVDRKIDITDSYGRVVKTMTLIQTNATINPGNSGGPLINRYGQVIGINTLKLTAEFEGIGFAIPINGAISIMNQLISDGKVSDRSESMVTGNASIGIQGEGITDEEAEYYGIPKGVIVIQINKNSSAAKAGLRRGDIIIEYNGQKVETTEEINRLKSRQKPGDEATLKVYRDGDSELEITFTLDMQEG